MTLPRLPARSPLLTVLMIAIGAVLLLPGLCTVIVMGALIADNRAALSDGGLILVWLLGLAVGAGGIALIWRGVRGR